MENLGTTLSKILTSLEEEIISVKSPTKICVLHDIDTELLLHLIHVKAHLY